jgi:CelD/BcsL family acetyltransferase involved in cellulose biosynthesis
MTTLAVTAPRIRAELIDDRESWSHLESEWDDLLQNSSFPSIFLSYDYLSRAWAHFHRRDSQLFLLTLRDTTGTLVGIAPFRRSTWPICRIPFRFVDYAATWEMDKPYILALPELEAECWRVVAEFFHSNPDQWDILRLPEMPTDRMGLGCLQRLFGDSRYNIEVSEGPSGVYIDLTGTPEAFVRKHKNFRAKLRKLRRLPQGHRLDVYDDLGSIETGFRRYVEIEQLSWKKGRVGVSKNVSHLAFYADVIKALAAQGRTAIWILSTGDTPISGLVTYSFGDTVYYHHEAYNPEFSSLSPGLLVIGLGIEGLLDSGFRRVDSLCGFADYLLPWASEDVRTSNITIHRKSFRMSLILWARKIKRLLRDSPPSRSP